MGTRAAGLPFSHGLVLGAVVSPLPPRTLGTELAVFSSFPAALTRNRVKNYHAKTITLIMRELLLSPSSQRLDFPDYFLQSPLNKSAQKIVSLTFFFFSFCDCHCQPPRLRCSPPCSTNTPTPSQASTPSLPLRSGGQRGSRRTGEPSPGTPACPQVRRDGNAVPACHLPPQNNPEPRAPSPWPRRDWEPGCLRKSPSGNTLGFWGVFYMQEGVLVTMDRTIFIST